MDLEALKAAALRSLNPKEPQHKKAKKVEVAVDQDTVLIALREAALKSKVAKSRSVNSTSASSISKSEAQTKFRRIDDSDNEGSDDETSVISILEEVEDTFDSDSENNHTADTSALLQSAESDTEERAIPDLLGADIIEFDEADLLLEEELMTPQLQNLIKQKSEENVNSTKSRKTEVKRSSAAAPRDMSNRLAATQNRQRDDSRSRSNRDQRRVPVLRRSRSRSPQAYRSRSPVRRRSRTPPLSFRTSSRSPNRSPIKRTIQNHADLRDRLSLSPKDSNDIKARVSLSPAHRSALKVSPKPCEQLQTDTSGSSAVDDDNLTEEERQTLIDRKKKFAKKKISSNKKVVKLKKNVIGSGDKSLKTVKKKTTTSISKRLGAKKPKVIRVTQSPDVVETVSLHDRGDHREYEEESVANQSIEEVIPPSTTKATKSTTPDVQKAVKKSLKERLGGYAKPESKAIPAKRSHREISLESSSEPEMKVSKTNVKTTKPKSTVTNKRRVILDVEDTKREEAGGDSRISVTKRNIWSRRDPAPDIIDVRNSDQVKQCERLDISPPVESDRPQGLSTARLRNRQADRLEPIEVGISTAKLRNRQAPKEVTSLSTARLRKDKQETSLTTETLRTKKALEDDLRETNQKASKLAKSLTVDDTSSDDDLDLVEDTFEAEKEPTKIRKDSRAGGIALKARTSREDNSRSSMDHKLLSNMSRARTSLDSDEEMTAVGNQSNTQNRRLRRDVSESEDRNGRRLPRPLSHDIEDRVSRRSAWAASRNSRSSQDAVTDENRKQRPVKTAEGGRNTSEKELDERIRKIKERNAKLEQRQKEIEREKLLYG